MAYCQTHGLAGTGKVGIPGKIPASQQPLDSKRIAKRTAKKSGGEAGRPKKRGQDEAANLSRIGPVTGEKRRKRFWRSVEPEANQHHHRGGAGHPKEKKRTARTA